MPRNINMAQELLRIIVHNMVINIYHTAFMLFYYNTDYDNNSRSNMTDWEPN